MYLDIPDIEKLKRVAKMGLLPLLLCVVSVIVRGAHEHSTTLGDYITIEAFR